MQSCATALFGMPFSLSESAHLSQGRRAQQLKTGPQAECWIRGHYTSFHSPIHINFTHQSSVHSYSTAVHTPLLVHIFSNFICTVFIPNLFKKISHLVIFSFRTFHRERERIRKDMKRYEFYVLSESLSVADTRHFSPQSRSTLK